MQIIADEFQSIISEQRLKNKTKDPLLDVRLISNNHRELLAPNYIYVGKDVDFFPFARDRNITAAVCIGNTSLEDLELYNDVDVIRIEDSSVEEIFNEIQLIFEKYNKWDEELSKAIMSHASIDNIAEIGKKVFPNPLAIFDSSIYCIAKSGDLPTNYKNPIWEALMKTEYGLDYGVRMRLAKVLGSNYNEKEETFLIKSFNSGIGEPFDILVSYIFQNGKRIGNIGMTQVNAPITYGHMHLMEHFAKRLKYWFVSDLNFINFDKPIKQLITNLLDGKHVSENAIKACADWINKSYLSDMYLLSFSFLPDDYIQHDSYLRYIEKKMYADRPQNKIVLLYKREVIIILQIAELRGSIQEYAESVKDDIEKLIGKVCVGISNPFSLFESIKIAYIQANQACTLGGIINPRDSIYKFSEYAIEYFIDKYLKDSLPEVFCHNNILKLHEYDCSNGTDYIKTLYEYYINMGNKTKTATALFIHRNSLTYRLKKISNIIGVDDLNDVNDILHYLLSCRLVRYISDK